MDGCPQEEKRQIQVLLVIIPVLLLTKPDTDEFSDSDAGYRDQAQQGVRILLVIFEEVVAALVSEAPVIPEVSKQRNLWARGREEVVEDHIGHQHMSVVGGKQRRGVDVASLLQL